LYQDGVPGSLGSEVSLQLFKESAEELRINITQLATGAKVLAANKITVLSSLNGADLSCHSKAAHFLGR